MTLTRGLATAWMPILLFALTSCEPSFESSLEEGKSTASVLRVGFSPTEDSSEIIRKNKPLMTYLQKQVGIDKVQFSVQPSFTATIEDLQNHKLDLVYFGALTYVLAKNVINITPLVRGVVNDGVQDQAVIIVNSDSDIQSLADLTGRSFAFGDVASTSGHLIPHQALLAAGIQPYRDFDRLIFTGGNNKSALAVLRKVVDAGAVNGRLLPHVLASENVNENKIRVIWRSHSFSDFPWVIRSDIDTKTKDAIRQAFLNLNDRELLNQLGIDKFQVTNDADFEDIRHAAIKLGFMQKNDTP